MDSEDGLEAWNKSALLDDRRKFVEHLRRLLAEGCRWLVVPLTSEEAARDEHAILRCSRCNQDAPDAAALYSIATHVAFEEEVLSAIEASESAAEFEARVARIVEEEATPLVCGQCCPRGKPHRHDLNHAF
ncbi:MAG TPA: hypothetical protein VEJ86_10945 [Candidatus Binataceae bacterium]|nr:hypothetical protein [Candidatus Binataceae bacterium]